MILIQLKLGNDKNEKKVSLNVLPFAFPTD